MQQFATLQCKLQPQGKVGAFENIHRIGKYTKLYAKYHAHIMHPDDKYRRCMQISCESFDVIVFCTLYNIYDKCTVRTPTYNVLFIKIQWVLFSELLQQDLRAIEAAF